VAARKTFHITAGAHTRAVLADAIAQYAAAAYPPGCSDCGQMAREILVTTAKGVAGEDDTVEISTRQRSMVRQAAQWYFDNLHGIEEDKCTRMADAMGQLLKGNEVDETIFSVSGPIK